MFMTGIGSGIDFNSMIEVIVASERAPKDNQLDRQEGMNHAEMDALKAIQSTLNSFRDTVEDLNSVTELKKLKAELSNSDVMGVSVGAGALAGEYNLEVTQLAQAQRDKLLTVDKGSYLSAGTIGFTTSKGDISIDIDALASKLKTDESTKKTSYQESLFAEYKVTSVADLETALARPENAEAKTNYEARLKEYDDKMARLTDKGVSLEELQSAINNHENNDGAKVSLLQSGGQVSLVLNAKETGVENAYTALNVADIQYAKVTVNGDGSETIVHEAVTDIADPQNPLQEALDAEVKFGTGANAITLTSSTNKMENAIDGLTFTLKETGTVNVTIARDEAGVKSTVKKFVDSYNKIMEAVNKYTKSSEDGAAALSGDAATRAMVTRLRQVISDEYSASTFQTLSQLGITTQQDGTLAIDDTKFGEAMEENYDQISALFMGDPSSAVPDEQDGLMTKMLTVLDDYHKSGGLFDVRIDRLEYSNEKIAEDREALDIRMEAKTISLRDYYAKMDSQIAQMNQTQNMLVGMLMS